MKGDDCLDEEYRQKVAENIGSVLARIRMLSGGRDVKLLLATKTVTADVINSLTGEVLIGENKVQELEEKYPLLKKDGLTVHFIGHLQTNKVRKITDKVSMIHSLDSMELAAEISKRSLVKGLKMPCLVEVNIGREADKGGVLPEDTERFVREASVLPGIKICGLMTMAPAHITPDEYRMYFSQTKNIFDRLTELAIPGTEMKELSMGMSDSYEEAVECGATIVRVGSAVFGRRV